MLTWSLRRACDTSQYYGRYSILRPTVFKIHFYLNPRVNMEAIQLQQKNKTTWIQLGFDIVKSNFVLVLYVTSCLNSCWARRKRN